MSVDNSLNNPTRNSTEPIQTRNSDAETEDDGSCAQSDASNAEEEDYEREEASTHKVSQVSTGVSHLGGPPANIHMENNSDVHIGSRLHYNAPVTINQYVHMLGNNEVTQDGILHEAVRAPIHELNPTRYIIPQGRSLYTSRCETLRAELQLTAGRANFLHCTQSTFSSSSAVHSLCSFNVTCASKSVH
jgi:hypothetical protein